MFPEKETPYAFATDFPPAQREENESGNTTGKDRVDHAHPSPAEKALARWVSRQQQKSLFLIWRTDKAQPHLTSRKAA